MSGIFPDPNRGGVPPSGNTCNSYVPTNGVTGDGPYYVSADCTTYFTDCMWNALSSEILAAVDLLGFSYNANRVDNLGQAIVARLQATGDGQWVIRTGDTMTGALHLPPVMPVFATQATHKAYVDQRVAVAQAAIGPAIMAAKVELTTEINKKVNRSGDTMTGELILNRHPVMTMEAATRGYVDDLFTRMNVGIQHAPADGLYYASFLGRWEPIAPFLDAPSNNFLYGRLNGQWQIIPLTGGPGGLTHAPADGRWYASRNGAWQPFTPGDGGGGDVPGNYVRITGDEMSGTLRTPKMEIDDKFYVTRYQPSGYNDPTTTNAPVISLHDGFFLMLDNAGQFHYTALGTWATTIDLAGNFSIRGEGYKPGGGLWASTSDERIKNIIGDYTGGLDQVLQLTPRVFTYRHNDTSPSEELMHQEFVDHQPKRRDDPGVDRPVPTGREFVGLIAQEVEDVMPELVGKNPGWIDGEQVWDMRSLDATPLIYALVNSVKELAARVTALEAKLAEGAAR